MKEFWGWILNHAVAIGLILGILGVILGLVYLYDFVTSRKKRKKKVPDVIPENIDGKKNSKDVARYAEDWRKKLQEQINEYKDKE